MKTRKSNLKTKERKISFSELKTWNECTHKHKLVYVDKLPHFSANEFTAFGTAVHAVCEEIVPAPSLGPKAVSIFEEKFNDEVLNLVTDGHALNEKLISEMRPQGTAIVKEILPALEDHFGEFEVFSVEEALLEEIKEFDSYEKKFKGFIDLVIRKGDEYHIIDWKTCTWGWDSRKKTDKILGYQLILYKNYFAKKHNIETNKVHAHFALLKRTSSKNRVEFVGVTSGKQKIDNSLNLLEKAVINIEKGFSIKNRLSCKYCKFYNTENCR